MDLCNKAALALAGLKSEVQHRRIEAKISKRTYRQLSESERQAIALGRNKSTISRECKNNGGGNGYNAKYAQQRSDKRRCFVRPKAKLHRDGALFHLGRTHHAARCGGR